MKPYTYLIGWSKHNIWYYGVRYGKNCDPSDLWVTYFTSSKYVTEFRKIFGEPDIISIRRTFNNAKAAIACEDRVIRSLRLYENTNFLNKSYSGSIYYDEEVRKKISNSRKGKKAPWLKNKSEETIEKIRNTKTGVKQTKQHAESVSKALKKKYKNETHHSAGINLSEEHKLKISSGIKNSEKFKQSKKTMGSPGSKNPMFGKKHTLTTKELQKNKALNRPKACCIKCHKPKNALDIYVGMAVSNLAQHHKDC